MPPNVRRRQLRRYHATPMRFRRPDSDERHPAVIRDCSRSGLQFESGVFLAPGTDIRIDPNAYLLELACECPSGGFDARVIWCDRRPAQGLQAFIAGARFFPPAKA